MELVAEHKAHIVTTLIHKFDKALSTRKFQDESTEIFVLVDETQRTQLGMFAARMRQMFPNACYIGFTGTPLLTREKSDVGRFGGIIHTYAINQAVADGAIVPLLYEGRLVEIEQNKAAIDVWFERQTQGLTQAQKADLKKKYARAEMLNKADQVIYMRAFDINEHFRLNWQGTGFKAQLAAPSKAAALKYKAFLDEIGQVTSEVIISAPDEREGFDEVDADESADEVVAFWQRMMKRYGGAEEYEKQIVNGFKFGDDPEIRKDASPIEHVHLGLPPFLLVTAEKDLPTLPGMAEEFHKALLSQGCEVQYLMVEKRNHNSVMYSAIDPEDLVARTILEFIRRYSGGR